nr:hypothetical protein [Tanacetum cinerariifolium]
MMRAKFDIEKFDGTGDFGLCRIKMRALLIQHGCEAALEVLPVDMKAQTKTELNKRAHSTVILCLALTLEDMMATLNSKEIKERSETKGDDGERLYVREITDRRDSRQSRGKSRSKSRGGRLKCYIFQSDDHLKRNSSKNNRKKSTGYIKKDEQPSSNSLTYDDYDVMMTMSAHAQDLLDWIIDSRCSYHITPRDNYVYSLDGHAMATELNVSVEEKDCLVHIWHKRLGHISEAGLQVLENQGLFGKKSLENQTERTVKKLRTDNGLEFYNREFEQLCIKSGIARHLTVAGISQQNGVVDRMNRTLMNNVRCLLIQSGLPKTFWAEATCTVAYLINKSPSREIKKKTPMKMWSRHPSDYRMLRIFGCVTYLHNKQDKLEPRALKYVLLGNVVFNERVMYKDTLKDSGVGDKSVEELQVEVELQRLNNHTLEEDQTDQEDGDNEDAGDQVTDQPPNLTDYQLVRDKEPMTITKPLRFRDESNMVAYAFIVAEEEDTHEPLTYQETVAYKDNSKWKAAMKEEIDSFRKNKTWKLVDHPTGQKLMSCKWLFKLDMKTSFLHGNLEEVIYMRQPPGYEQDDMLIACKSKAEIGSAKSLLKKEFDMKDLREAKNIFGMEIVRHQSHKILRVSQSRYVSKILNNFRIDNGKSVKMPLGGHFKLSLKNSPVRDYDVERMSKVPYANEVGSLMYLMVCTRPDIAYAGCVVSWKKTLQHVVALSTTKVEYMDFTEAVKEAIWLRGLLEELGVELNTVAVNCDNRGVIHLSRNHVFHERTKHINARYHFIREVLEAKTVKVLKVGTEHNTVDALTKVVPGLKSQHCLELLHIAESCCYVTRTRKEFDTIRGCIAQMTTFVAKLQAMENDDVVYNALLAAKDAKRGEESKLLALTELIAEALEDIHTLKLDLKILSADGNGV